MPPENNVDPETTSPESTPGAPDRDSDDDEHSVDWAKASMVSVLGVELAGFLVLGVVGGHYVDQELGTSPLFILAGLFLALAAAGLQLWRFATRVGGHRDDDE